MDLDLVANLQVVGRVGVLAHALALQKRDHFRDRLLVLLLVRDRHIHASFALGRFFSHAENERRHRVAALALECGDVQPIWIAQQEVHLGAKERV